MIARLRTRLMTADGGGRPSALALLLNNHLAAFGLVVVVAVLLLALMTPVLGLPDPDATDLASRLKKPFTDGHLLGTDHLGRDMLSRILWGARVSIAVGLVATLVAALIGSALGLVAGFFGGRVDNVLMRGIDMLMAFPYMLLALAIVAVLGPGLMNALFAIAIVNIPFFARNVRGVTLGLAGREFVDAARLSGMGDGRILAYEVLPNVMPVIVITMSTTVGWMILETAGLSFLGLGAQPPQADLGSMLGDGRKLIITAPHVATVPGIAIFILVMGINLLGDGIRDVLDPRLKSGALVRPAPATEVAAKTESAETKSLSPVRGGPGEEGAADLEGGERPILEVVGLTTRFVIGNQLYKAVEGVDFAIRPGECVGIVGESGSGKSVTALSLMRLVPTPPGRIAAGRVLYREGARETDLVRAPFEDLRRLRGDRIAYVFQDPLTTLHPMRRVGDQIAEAILAHHPVSYREARARAVKLLAKVQIPNPAARARVYPHELSGGMRQRIGIAMALANDPDVIIADEPTTALDVTVQAQVLRLLDQLRREQGAALLFITHDFGVVSEICDRVLVMYAGQVVETGTADQVLAAPRHPYTARLIDCVPRLGEPDRAIAAIPGLPPAVNDLPQGCAFAERCLRAEAACRQEAIELVGLAKGRAVRCLHPVEGAS